LVAPIPARTPSDPIREPRMGRRLPKHVLTISEAEQVLQQPDIHGPLGLRDRAILEVLYSCGIRRSEVIHLKLYDLDSKRGTL
jgi:integrase/recombinase XerD